MIQVGNTVWAVSRIPRETSIYIIVKFIVEYEYEYEYFINQLSALEGHMWYIISLFYNLHIHYNS